jgi:branched-chain amino acid transport system substrate-binding protein
VVLPELYPAGTEDFTDLIAALKADGCEICSGAMSTADLLTFWKQAAALGYRPKVVTIGDALVFPQAVEAVGPGALHMTAESLWHPDWPYTDSITGKSATSLAADYQEKTGEQWTPAIAQYAKLEWAVAALRTAPTIDDRHALLSALRTVQVDTCLGPLDFTTPVSAEDLDRSKRPVENVYKSPVGGVQWVEGEGFDFRPAAVSDINNPDLPAAGGIRPMTYEAA